MQPSFIYSLINIFEYILFSYFNLFSHYIFLNTNVYTHAKINIVLGTLILFINNKNAYFVHKYNIFSSSSAFKHSIQVPG